MADKRTSKIGESNRYDVSGASKDFNVDEYFESIYRKETENAKKINDYKLKLERERVLKQQKELEESLKRVYNEVDNMIGLNEQQRVQMRERLERETQKNLFKKQIEDLEKYYKIEEKNKTAAQKSDERKKKLQETQRAIDVYKSVLKDSSATDEQKENAKKQLEVLDKQQQVLKSEENFYQWQIKVGKTLVSLASGVDSKMGAYVGLQMGMNARLQGISRNANSLGTLMNPNDIYGRMSQTLTTAVGIQPYFKTETMLNNLSALINEGIASNVEQRAFLQTASENIANTFDVANSALLRIVRLQQQDSSAARLGMEAYLTKFLNKVVENTEYLNSTFDSVQDALLEASSQMSIQGSTELEFTIQKWLGSLVGMGMSESTASNIAQAIGYLGSGNVSALEGSNLQNLLIMAASRGNLNYGDLLTGGLSSSAANTLMANLVQYMMEIGQSKSNVVRSQFANTFGISYSDLVAAANLGSQFQQIYEDTLSFGGMYSELANQLSAIPGRMNVSTMLNNLFENVLWGSASNIAQNPALMASWKVAGMIKGATGGTPIPVVSALGNFFDTKANVEDLVQVGIMGMSSLGLIGDIISGLGNTFAPSGVLGKLGISSGGTQINRGSGLGTFVTGLTTSASSINYIGQGSGEDIGNLTYLQYKEDNTSTVASLSEEEQERADASLNIYKYLSDNDFSGKLDSLVRALEDIQSKVEEIKIHTTV